LLLVKKISRFSLKIRHQSKTPTISLFIILYQDSLVTKNEHVVLNKKKLKVFRIRRNGKLTTRFYQ
jgi:hypothetical protein